MATNQPQGQVCVTFSYDSGNQTIEGQQMRTGARIRLTTFLTVMTLLIVVAPANAYIDPASGSVVFQALIAGLAAAGTGLAMFWSRIVTFFRRSPKGDTTDVPASRD